MALRGPHGKPRMIVPGRLRATVCNCSKGNMEISMLNRVLACGLLVAAGMCASVRAGNCGGQWLPGTTVFEKEIWAMTPYQGELVVAGDASFAPSLNSSGPVKWNGSAWSAKGSLNLSFSRALGVHDDVLYVGGLFYAGPNDPRRGIVQWNGTDWSALPESLPTSWALSKVYTFGEYQGKLLAAGQLQVSAPNYDAGFLWDGEDWQSLGAVLNSSAVTSTAVYQGDLYISGSGGLAGVSNSGSVLRYDGSTWSKLGAFGVKSGGVGAVVLRVYQGKLYMAAATVRTPGLFNYGPLATWDGVQVQAAAGLGTEGDVTAMTEYNGDLIIGGAFVNGFGVGANGVVRWNGTNFATLGQGITGTSSTGRRVNCLDVYNGELIAGGNFDTAGGVASPYFARWTDNPKPWVAVSPVSQPANEGLTLTLSAAAASGYANVTYKWQRNGVDVANGSGGASAGGGTVSGASGTLTSPSDGSSVLLTINGIQASDAGAYTIVFSNGCNDATSAAAAVSVNTCPGDLNTDGVIDDADFTIFVGAYNVLVCEDPAMPVGCPADLNGDGLVEDLDFQVFIVGYDALVCE